MDKAKILEIPGTSQTLAVYQIYYEKSQLPNLDPEFTPYFNPRANCFLENQVIADLIQAGAHRQADYFGIVSWKFTRKTRLRGTEVRHGIGQNPGRDIYHFFGADPVNVWEVGDDIESGIRVAVDPGVALRGERILKKLSYPSPLRDIRSPNLIQNHFIARAEIFETYCQEMLWPALQSMTDSQDPELVAELNRPAFYPGGMTDTAHLKTVFGIPHYTYHPFVAERLFGSWTHLKPSLKFGYIAPSASSR